MRLLLNFFKKCGVAGTLFLFYTPSIGGHHPMLYFTSQITKKYSVVLCYNFGVRCASGNVLLHAPGLVFTFYLGLDALGLVTNRRLESWFHRQPGPPRSSLRLGRPPPSLRSRFRPPSPTSSSPSSPTPGATKPITVKLNTTNVAQKSPVLALF